VDKKKKKMKMKKKINKQGSKLPTTSRHVGKPPVTDNRDGSFNDAKITQTTCNPKYPCRFCKGSHILKDLPGLSKVIEAGSTHPHQHMSSTSEQHTYDLPSTSRDVVGKKKSRVKFLCMLCRGSHQIYIFPHMDEASKFLEDMTIYQPQLPASYHKLTLNPPIVDGMINLVPSSVSLVDHLVNLVMSLVEPVDKVELILSSVDLILPLECVTQSVDPFPPIKPILPLENVTQVINWILSSINHIILLESKTNYAHVFLIDTKSTMLGGIPPSPMEPPPSNESILFYWGVLTGPRLPSHIPFNITVQVCGRDIPQTLIGEGLSISIFPSISWKALGHPQLVSVIQNMFSFNRRKSQP
jgi:hypothetical protein